MWRSSSLATSTAARGRGSESPGADWPTPTGHRTGRHRSPGLRCPRSAVRQRWVRKDRRYWIEPCKPAWRSPTSERPTTATWVTAAPSGPGNYSRRGRSVRSCQRAKIHRPAQSRRDSGMAGQLPLESGGPSNDRRHRLCSRTFGDRDRRLGVAPLAPSVPARPHQAERIDRGRLDCPAVHLVRPH